MRAVRRSPLAAPPRAVAPLPSLTALLALGALLSLAQSAAAQLIPIKTVPLAEGDQFGFLPSANLAMAGVSIALPDSLLDPFINPGRGGRVQGARFFGSPAFYSLSRNAGSGRTLPLGGVASSGNTFAGFALALQEISPAGPDRNVIFAEPVAFDRAVIAPLQPALPTRSGPKDNKYAFALAGRQFPRLGLSVGGSAFWSGLHAMDGVDMLYPGSASIAQAGQSVDYRLGMTKLLAGNQSMDVLLLHNRFGMTHDVGYSETFWDPTLNRPSSRLRSEHNEDRTNLWGAHLQYQRPLLETRWRIGGIATANVMSHPKIPNYAIMSIPRDPGRSSAYNLGIGVSTTQGPTTAGMDVIYEPIWSYTWADAASPVGTRLGGVIPTGGKTIENRFRFQNAVLRAGLSQDIPIEESDATFRLQAGFEGRHIGYHMHQVDNVQLASRMQRESWLESTFAWGFSVLLPSVELRYRGRQTSGTGRPQVAGSGNVFPNAAAVGTDRNFLIAPSGPLTLDEVYVTTHQFSISLPFHRGATGPQVAQGKGDGDGKGGRKEEHK
jgi:hypothetical protein